MSLYIEGVTHYSLLHLYSIIFNNNMCPYSVIRDKFRISQTFWNVRLKIGAKNATCPLVKTLLKVWSFWPVDFLFGGLKSPGYNSWQQQLSRQKSHFSYFKINYTIYFEISRCFYHELSKNAIAEFLSTPQSVFLCARSRAAYPHSFTTRLVTNVRAKQFRSPNILISTIFNLTSHFNDKIPSIKSL